MTSFTVSYIVKLKDEFSRTARQVGRAAKDLERSLKTLAASQKSLKALKGGNFSHITKELRNMARYATLAAKAMAAIKPPNIAAKGPLSHLRSQLHGVARDASNASRSLKTIRTPHIKPVRLTTIRTDKHVTSHADRFQSRRSQLSMAIPGPLRGRLQGNDLSLTAGVAGGLGLGFLNSAKNQAISSENSFAQVKKAGEFSSKAEFEATKNSIINLSSQVVSSADDLALMGAAGLKAGVAIQDLTVFLKTAAKGANAFDMEASDAGEAMAKMKILFNLDSNQMIKAMDMINQTDKDYNSTAKNTLTDIATLLAGPMLSTYKQTGRNVPQMDALKDAVMLSVVGEQLGMRHKQFSNAMVSTQAIMMSGKFMGSKEDQAAIIKKTGFNPYKHLNMFRKDKDMSYIDYLNNMLGDLGKLDQKQMLGTISSFFGKENTTELAALVTKRDEFKRIQGTVKNDPRNTGSMEKEFVEQMSTMTSQNKLFENSINRLMTTLGNEMLPILKLLNAIIIPIVDTITAVNKAVPGLTGVILAITGILSTLLVAISAVGILGIGLNAAGITVTFLTGTFWLLTGAIASTVLGLVPFALAVGVGVLAINFLSDGINYCIATIPGFAQGFLDAAAVIESTFTAAINTAVAAINLLGAGLQTVINLIPGLGDIKIPKLDGVAAQNDFGLRSVPGQGIKGGPAAVQRPQIPQTPPTPTGGKVVGGAAPMDFSKLAALVSGKASPDLVKAVQPVSTQAQTTLSTSQNLLTQSQGQLNALSGKVESLTSQMQSLASKWEGAKVAVNINAPQGTVSGVTTSGPVKAGFNTGKNKT